MHRRTVYSILLIAIAGGCGSPAQPPQSGGRTASYWAEVLEKPDPDVALRRKAATKIGTLVLLDDVVMPALLAALKDPDPEVRSNAARSLGVYSGARGVEALPALQEIQSNDPNKKVREAAAKAVETITAQ
jgi:HEAT repeat protein